ncbi:MAG: hypothetical protein ACX933_18150, partial [Marinobacter adhaerens]
PPPFHNPIVDTNGFVAGRLLPSGQSQVAGLYTAGSQLPFVQKNGFELSNSAGTASDWNLQGGLQQHGPHVMPTNTAAVAQWPTMREKNQVMCSRRQQQIWHGSQTVLRADGTSYQMPCVEFSSGGIIESEAGRSPSKRSTVFLPRGEGDVLSESFLKECNGKKQRVAIDPPDASEVGEAIAMEHLPSNDTDEEPAMKSLSFDNDLEAESKSVPESPTAASKEETVRPKEVSANKVPEDDIDLLDGSEIPYLSALEAFAGEPDDALLFILEQPDEDEKCMKEASRLSNKGPMHEARLRFVSHLHVICPSKRQVSHEMPCVETGGNIMTILIVWIMHIADLFY